VKRDEIIADLVRSVVAEEASRTSGAARRPTGISPQDVKLAKRAAVWLGTSVASPGNPGAWSPAGTQQEYLASTPARLGVGRAGTRTRTTTSLDFLVDHAAARDAVASMVDPGVASALGFVPLASMAEDKRQFLARPDLGRRLSEESLKIVRQKATKSPQVQLAAVDGLSATALTVNLPLVVPALMAEFQRLGIRTGTPFVVHNGRVVAGDELARATGAEVLCLLVGERPGLKTAESMGAYVTFMKARNFNEAMRYVVSNIHKDGLKPDEAARQIAALCRKALDEKKTGVDFSS
jgi:ethanolamine ammonia-lyase small subunit